MQLGAALAAPAGARARLVALGVATRAVPATVVLRQRMWPMRVVMMMTWTYLVLMASSQMDEAEDGWRWMRGGPGAGTASAGPGAAVGLAAAKQ